MSGSPSAAVFLAVCQGLLELQHLLPLAFVLAVLAGSISAFGLPRVLIPDDDGWISRFWNGVAVSGFLLAVAFGVTLSDPVVEVMDERGASGRPTLWLFLFLGVLAAAAPIGSAILRRRRERRPESSERDRDLGDPMRPDLDEALTFSSGLAPGAVLALLFLLSFEAPAPNLPLHGLAAVGVAGASFVLFSAAAWSAVSTAASTLAAFLAWVILVWGFLDFHGLPASLLVLGGLLVGVAVRHARGDPYQFVPHGLSPEDEKPLTEPDLSAFASASPEQSGHTFDDDVGGPKRPLVIVCANGGGSRAAVWVLRTLIELERRVGDVFRPHLFFGASGGMLGVTRYVTAAKPDDRSENEDDPRVAAVEKDSLRNLVCRFLTRDLPSFFMWWIDMKEHRGIAIEKAWRTNFGLGERDLTLGEYTRAPHVVFSPMCVEDGRRLIISNLDLARLTQARGPETKHDLSGAASASDGEPAVTTDARRRLSTSAFEFARLFGPEAAGKMSFFTAARMSATFPYFMPISCLPTQPRRRLVDAGYYDNYGVSLAAGWLEWALDEPARRAWLESRVSRVVVIQIRDGVLRLTKPVAEPPQKADTLLARLHRALESLTGPIFALTQFRESAQLFGNDERLADVLTDLNERIGRPRGDPEFATTVCFELGVRASLTWALSRTELTRIRTWTTCQPFVRRCDVVASLLKGGRHDTGSDDASRPDPASPVSGGDTPALR